MDKNLIIQELVFKAVRSGGAGGQHVNKVSTKIELLFDVNASNALSEIEKGRIIEKLGGRLTKDHVLLLQCDESRSQSKNKALVIERFQVLIESALKVAKKRKETKPTKTAIEKRLQQKKEDGQKKIARGKPKID